MKRFLRRTASVVLALSLAAGLIPAGISNALAVRADDEYAISDDETVSDVTEDATDDVTVDAIDEETDDTAISETVILAEEDVVTALPANANGREEILTAEDLSRAFANGGDYIFGNNIDASGYTLELSSGNLDLDLNGKELIVSSTIYERYSTLTIRDSSSSGSGVINSSATGVAGCLQLYGGTINLIGVTINSPNTHTVSNTRGSGGVLNIEGGTLNPGSGQYAVYLYRTANVTINGGTINGSLYSKGTAAEYAFTLTGGKYSSNVVTQGSTTTSLSSFIPEGYQCTGPDADGYYTVAAIPQGYTVTLTGGANATPDGDTTQTVDGPMDTVTYAANEGYYFEQFEDIVDNGVTAKWIDASTVTVFGTPTADTEITVPDAVGKVTPSFNTLPTVTMTYGQTFAESTVDGTAYDGSTVIPGAFSWDSSIASVVPNVSESGTSHSYHVIFTPNDTTTYKVVEVSFALTVTPADITVTPPQPVAGLVYTGNEQALVTEGTASAGNMVYSLDGVNYSAAIPTGTAADTYTVYYDVLEDSGNYNDFTPATVTATISEYSPLLMLRADSSKVFLDIRIPYVNGAVPSVTWGGSEVTLIPGPGDTPTYGYFTIDCAIKNMIDEKTLTVTLGETELYSGKISVASYLKAIITNYPGSTYSNIAIAMLRYGSAAQVCLNYPFSGMSDVDPRLANYGVPDAAISTIYNYPVPSTGAPTVEAISSAFNNNLHDCTYYGMNMTYTYDTSFLIAFRITGSRTLAMSELETLFSGLLSEYHYNWTVTEDSSHNYMIVTFQNLPINSLGSTLFWVDNVRINAVDYLARITADGSGKPASVINLCRALYAYYRTVSGV